MRAPIIILPLALGSVPSVSTAAPPARNAAVPIVAAARKADAIREIHLLDRLVERERAPLGPPVLAPIPRAPSAPRRGPALDCVHATHDITVDPKTGVTDAKLELRVKAVGAALGAVSFAFDGGLKPGTVTASGGHDATVAQDTFGGSRVVRVDLAPALAAGDETVISMPYSGTLACAPTESSAVVCSKSSDFAYLAQQSIFPLIFDPEAADDFSFDGYTRDIVLRVPAAHDVVATGQKVSESVDGGKKISRWSIDKPLSRNVGVYAFIGELGMKEVPGRSVPTTFVFPMPASPIDDSLVSWSTPALDFVEQASGAKLPFDRNLSLVRLPQTIGDPGTATFGMTLLSDSYAKTGDLMYEETWAHENTHLFWGIIVPETDASESRLMTEGLATLTQIEYSHGRHFADEDRDLYLARRFLPMGLDLRVTGKDLPPPVLLPQSSMAESLRTRRYTMWAYYRTAITLDHLRVTVGEELFAEALATYKARCSFVGCRPDVLRTILGETTGKDMTTFFDRWVTGKERPRVRVGFVPTASGVDIALTKDDDRSMTLELWLQLAGGERVKRLVDLGPRVTRTHLDSQASVLSVAASPRHDVLVDVSSAVDGDLDFDGESDGFDVLRCARLTGSTYDAKPASGLWNARETFDARCDVNGDLTIDDRDLDQLAAHFGTLRGR